MHYTQNHDACIHTTAFAEPLALLLSPIRSFDTIGNIEGSLSANRRSAVGVKAILVEFQDQFVSLIRLGSTAKPPIRA